MAAAKTKSKRRTKEEVLKISFSGSALQKIKELALYLNIPQENLSEVLVKGIKILDLSREGKLIIDKEKERLTVDVKRV